MEQKRETFSSSTGFILAAVGSAVGLGNLWGFPYKMGSSGGFAFLLLYVVMAVFVGIIVMLGEMVIGRKTGKSAIGAYRMLCKKYTWLGYVHTNAVWLIMAFYCVLGAIALRFFVGYVQALFGASPFGDGGTSFYSIFKLNGWSMVLYLFVFILINILINSAGVTKGIERFNKIAMPILFVFLIAVVIYVAVQPGAAEGYKFMFGWNIEPLKEDFVGVLKSAAGQMFFSLSVGEGIMIAYGSYARKEEDLQKGSILTVICDSLVGIVAGMVVLPACAAFGKPFQGGPGLLFEAMQDIFSHMGSLGVIFGLMFFALILIATISSSISIMESAAGPFIDKAIEQGKPEKRKKIIALVALACFVIGIPVALDGIGVGTAGGAAIPTPAELFGVEVAGWSDCWLDFYDMLTEATLMPFGAMIMCLLIGWKLKPEMVFDEVESSGVKFRGRKFYSICFKFIAPIGILFVLYGQLSSFFGF